jgi:uncharacterized membrane protein YccC
MNLASFGFHLLWSGVVLLLIVVTALAQEEQPAVRDIQVPNSMGPHTWFIIVAVGLFLAWCISYSLQLQKEALTRRPKPDDILRQKEEILNRLAALEKQRESGKIAPDAYEREFRKAKARLAETLARLAQRTTTER